MAKKCEGVKKGAWTKEENNLLRKCIDTFGEGKWHQVPLRSGLNRCRQSCRLRWLNYLKPNLKRGYFTKDEVDLILRLHKLWSLIAGRLPGRTANDVKNFWNTHISKKPAATKQSRSKSKTSRKAINNINIVIRPRPRTLIFPKLDFLSHSTELTNPNGENLSIIMKPPSTPKSYTTEDDNKELFKEEAKEYCRDSDQNQTCESLLQVEEIDDCIQWWSCLLETTKNVQPFSEEGSLSSLELSGPGSSNDLSVDTLVLEN